MSRYSGRLPRTFAAAVKLSSGRQSRKLANNTYLTLGSNGEYEVTYHGNTIATFHQDGTIILTTCGYGAATSTNERLSAMAPEGTHFARRNYVGVVRQFSADGKMAEMISDTVRINPDRTVHVL